MPQTTISAGMSVKRPGAEQYSSDGYHLSVEMETDVKDAAGFRAAVHALFAEVKAALATEVAGHEAAETQGVNIWAAPGGNGGNGSGQGDSAGAQGKPEAADAPKPAQGRPARSTQGASRQSHPASGRTSSDDAGGRAADRVSNKQAQYIFGLARKAGLRTQSEVTNWLGQTVGIAKSVYDLTKQEASRAIEVLAKGNGGDDGNGNGKGKRQ